MDNLVTILAIGLGAAFVCLFAMNERKRRAIVIFFTIILIIAAIFVAVTLIGS